MGSSIHVETDTIKIIRDKVNTLSEEYKNSYEEVYKCVNEIFEYESWLGEDARMFNSKIKGFKNDFQDLYNKFITYSNYLKKAAEAYDNSQQGIETKASKLSTSR